jgi:hypothetical protein
MGIHLARTWPEPVSGDRRLDLDLLAGGFPAGIEFNESILCFRDALDTLLEKCDDEMVLPRLRQHSFLARKMAMATRKSPTRIVAKRGIVLDQERADYLLVHDWWDHDCHTVDPAS